MALPKEFTPFYRNAPVEHVTLPAGITFPVKYAAIRRFMVNNTFGMVRNGGRRAHQGWDFYAPIGFRCYAIADGTIAAVHDRGALGKHVLLRFEFDLAGDGQGKRALYATYCHLSRIDVRVGQKVRMNDPIGLTGDTGNARGMTGADAHLHFEIRTSLWVPLGLGSRFSPMAVFGQIPIKGFMVTDPMFVP
jgi:murein DD-endopeptidase MepM/ murein hydrolase activator NlpD